MWGGRRDRRAGPRPAALARLILASLALVAAGCGASPEAPVLSELRCRSGTRSCQTAADPFRVELEVDFQDADGDLGAGLWQIFLDDTAEGERAPLGPLFEESGVDPAATGGTLRFDLDLKPDAVRQGEEVRVGLQVWDARLHASNRPAVRLRLEISP